VYFCNYANAARGPSGLGRPVSFDLWEKRGQRGPAGPKAEWAGKGGRAESEEESFFKLEIRF
jgi:hypothetical protein